MTDASSPPAAGHGWQSVRDAVLERIRSRVWAPGQPIPHEADLAREFGCARVTVNRALQALAEAGLIERRRRAGSRVSLEPIRKATLEIPVIRAEIAGKGLDYGYSLLSIETAPPPPDVRARMQGTPGAAMLHVRALHLADGRPYAIEDRWLDPEAVPEAAAADFTRQSPNEWLVQNVPFEGGDIAFSAHPAGAAEARELGCAQGSALFLIERVTWRAGRALTSVRLIYAPGHRLHTRL